MDDSFREPLLGPEEGNAADGEHRTGTDDLPSEGSDARRRASSSGGGAFRWVAPLLALGSRRGRLHHEDLFDLPPELEPEACGRALWRCWKKEERSAFKAGREPSLLRAMAAAYGRPYLGLGALKLAGDALNFAGPLLLNGLLRHLDAGRGPGAGGRPPFVRILGWTADVRTAEFGYACAGLLAASLVLKAFLNVQYNYRQGLIASRLRSALTCVVFRRTLRCNTAALAAIGSGRVQTLMSVDARRAVDLCLSLHELWSLPAQIGIALALLYWQVQAAFLAGLFVVLALVPVNRALAARIQGASAAMMDAKDRRVGTAVELLRGVRAVKAACWERVFAARMGAARRDELSALAVRKYLDALCVYFWAATSLLFSITTFGLFVLLGRTLTSEIVFTSLALFNVLLAPINAFPWVVNGVVEALVSVRRVGDFLRDPRRLELAQRAKNRLSQTPLFSGSPMSDEAAATVVVTDGTFAWTRAPDSGANTTASSSTSSSTSRQITNSSSSASLAQPVLRDINLVIPAGTLAAVVGEVGSGKSSLLAALLGEMESLGPRGAAAGGGSPLRGLVAYVAQDPWVMHASVRDNILMGRPMQTERYREVLHACALLPDLAAMPAGDATVVGGGGATLSGGQRARLALACALYRNADVYLLDDCLAAVDAHVAAWLVRHALLGPLLAGKTTLLVGHAAAAVAAADLVVRMEGGRIAAVEAGQRLDPEPLGAATAGEEGEAAAAPAAAEEEAAPPAAEELSRAPLDPASGDPGSPATAAAARDGDGSVGQEEEERVAGHVRWEVYRGYLKATGWPWVATILLSMLLMQATRNGNDLWLSYWVSQTPPSLRPAVDPCVGNGWRPVPQLPLLPPQQPWVACHPAACLDGSAGCSTAADGGSRIPPDVKFYLTVLLGIAGSNSVFTLVRAFSFAKGGLVAAQRLHDQLVAAVLRLPAAFFDATPPGRILNRLSSDTATVDDSLPFILNILLANAFSIGGVLVILCIAQPWALLAVLPLALLYRRLQLYYRATSRELRRLDSVAGAPVYTTFSEALAGGATIRACGAQRHFLTTAEGAVAGQARASLASLAASCWLGLRLQLLAAALAAAVAAAAVLQHHRLLPGASTMAAGLLGLSLSYVLPITGLLNGLLTSSAETEQEMVSVERVMQYLALPGQPDVLPITASQAPGDAAALGSDEETDPLIASAAAAEQGIVRQPAKGLGPDWPAAGHVAYRGVWLRYSPGGPYVLQGVDLDLPPGAKFGVCGRTGAGKSSLVSCLLRLAEVSAGRIEVDGRDVATVPLQRLRGAIGLVPQAPFLFRGTVRDNLDPCRRHSDDALEAALRDAQLWEALQALSSDRAAASAGAAGAITAAPAPAAAQEAARVLGLELGEAGAGLSRGQQQLLALARVVLRQPRVLCLDEASASVDPQTAAVMQRVVRERFRAATVVEVAHRLASIEGCDAVAVMDAGRVVEVGPPRELAAKQGSAFASMLSAQQRAQGGSEP